MAYLVVADPARPSGTRLVPCDIHRAARAWLIHHGEQEPENEAQAAYMASVVGVIMNPKNPLCPESYRIARQHVHEAMSDKRHQAEQLPWHAITGEGKETV